ncbi:MAG: methylase [Aerococcus sp.]|nr:methylase [Aerococcus sp.]
MDEGTYQLQEIVEPAALIKSKARVQTHGEVFTPKWMVQKMLAEPAIQEKLQDIHATFLEPSAGEGAFLVEILHQKLNHVDQTSSKTRWPENALWALMSIYGIELLHDNLNQARAAMMSVATSHYQAIMQKPLNIRSDFYKAAQYVIGVNIVQGNTLEYTTEEGQPITLSHWWPVDTHTVQRELFTYQSLFKTDGNDEIGIPEGQMSLFEAHDYNPHYAPCKVTKVYREEMQK